MSQAWTPFVRAAVRLTKLLGFSGGETNEAARRIASFASYPPSADSFRRGEVSTRESCDFLPEDVITLVKKPGEDFRILNIADIHLSDYDYRLVYGYRAMRKVRRLVRAVKPDLITLSGDQTCGEGSVRSVDYLVKSLEKLGVPWAPVFGNHDDESDCDLNYIADRMLEGGRCLFRKGSPEMGCGNYALRIVSGGRPVEQIFMMDFHHGIVNSLQTAWFVQGCAAADCECSVLGHIPVPEFDIAFGEASLDGKKRFREGCGAFGKKGEEVCCVREDGASRPSGLFETALASGRVRHFFCAHDHLNDYSLLYKGVRLTYMLKTGKGAGNTWGMNGGTVVTVGDGGIKKIEHVSCSFFFPVVIEKTVTPAR